MLDTTDLEPHDGVIEVVYSPDGTELGTCAVGAQESYPFRRSVFSGDGLRALIAYPDSQVLRMATASF